MQNVSSGATKTTNQSWWVAIVILIVDIVIVTPFYISLGFFALLSGTLLPGFVLISSCVVAILGGIISLLIKKNIAAIVFLAGVPFAAYMLMNFLYS